MMYREIVSRKRVPVIFIVLLSVTIILYLYEIIERAIHNKHESGFIVGIILSLFIAAVIVREIKSCFISYKYSVIADKLIINSIRNKEENNLESIRISDILYIGSKKDMPKEYRGKHTTKRYLCGEVGKEYYYCVYKRDNCIKKVKFQPSCKLINKINNNGLLK